MKRIIIAGASACLTLSSLVGCNDRQGPQRTQPIAKSTPHEINPAKDAKPADAAGAATTDAKGAEPKAADTPTSIGKATDAKPTDTKTADVKPTDAKATDTKPADTKPADVKPTDKPTDGKTAAAPAGGGTPFQTSTPDGGEPAPYSGDYTEWGGQPTKNNVAKATNLPIYFSGGKVDLKTGKRKPETMKNIKWAAALGSQTYANPVIAGGQVMIGTNNGNGYLKRYAPDVDACCLLAFREADGKFLWQYTSEKLPTGKTHDWELLGICSTPIVEGDRAWFMDNRGEVVCVDTKGFYDDEDDGPVTGDFARLADIATSEDAAKNPVPAIIAGFKDGKLDKTLVEALAKVDVKLPETATVAAGKTPNSWTTTLDIDGVKRDFLMRMEGPKLSVYWKLTTADKNEADVVWKLDCMKTLGSSQHNATSCSGVIAGDLLFITTSNGVDAQHNNVPAPQAPSYLCLEKATGKVVWTDNSPGVNILHGQWSSPSAAILGGVPQVIFACGDGWLRSFRAERTKDGKSELLWKFDCNPKDALYEIRGLGTRNHIIGTPMIYKGHVFVAVGEDPEHGDGVGHLWCVDPTKRGDISPTLAVNRSDPSKVIEIPQFDPVRRLQTIDAAKGEVAIPNPNSGMVWHYESTDINGDGEIDDLQEKMHRSLSTCTIKDDILYTADFSGIMHCVDAKTGKAYWTHDMLGDCWGSCLIADGKVFIGDEDGDVYIFAEGKEKKWLNQNPEEENNPTINMGSSVLGTPVVANNVLYIFNKNTLFAIENKGETADVKPAAKEGDKPADAAKSEEKKEEVKKEDAKTEDAKKEEGKADEAKPDAPK